MQKFCSRVSIIIFFVFITYDTEKEGGGEGKGGGGDEGDARKVRLLKTPKESLWPVKYIQIRFL